MLAHFDRLKKYYANIGCLKIKDDDIVLEPTLSEDNADVESIPPERPSDCSSMTESNHSWQSDIPLVMRDSPIKLRVRKKKNYKEVDTESVDSVSRANEIREINNRWTTIHFDDNLSRLFPDFENTSDTGSIDTLKETDPLIECKVVQPRSVSDDEPHLPSQNQEQVSGDESTTSLPEWQDELDLIELSLTYDKHQQVEGWLNADWGCHPEDASRSGTIDLCEWEEDGCEIDSDDSCIIRSKQPTKIEPKNKFNYKGRHAIIQYKDDDFINRPRGSGVYMATTDFAFSKGLQAELRREMKDMEPLFNQRKKVGQVAIHPRINKLYPDYIFFLLIAVDENRYIERSNLEKCLIELRELALTLDVKELCFPMVDPIRKISWEALVNLVDRLFWDTEIRITAYKYYYLALN